MDFQKYRKSQLEHKCTRQVSTQDEYEKLQSSIESMIPTTDRQSPRNVKIEPDSDPIELTWRVRTPDQVITIELL